MPRSGLLRLVWARARSAATLLLTFWKLVRHPGTSAPARFAAMALLVYALSPVDLIPDVVPLLGVLDDLVLLPLGAALVQRLVPPQQWRAREDEARRDAVRLKRWMRVAAGLALLWLVVLLVAAAWLLARTAS